MRYGLIGCGRIAPRHLKAAYASGMEVVAVCDREEQQAQRLLSGEGYRGRTVGVYRDYQTMLQREQLDVVAVAVPSGSHASIALDCLQAGAHVLVEKPMALSLSDADAMIRSAGERGRYLIPCHQNRFNPAVLALHRAVAENRLGRLSHAALTLRWNRKEDYYRQAAWRGRWATDGGILMNQCIHGIDLLRWISRGEPVWVCGALARRMHPQIEAEDTGVAAIRFSDGMLATVEASGNIYPSNLEETLSFFGEKGTIRIGGAAAGRVEVWRVEGEEPPVCEPQGSDVYGSGHQALYADAVDAIAGGRQPFLTGEDGRAALELVLAIYRSHKQNGPVILPLDDFSTAEMEGTF